MNSWTQRGRNVLDAFGKRVATAATESQAVQIVAALNAFEAVVSSEALAQGALTDLLDSFAQLRELARLVDLQEARDALRLADRLQLGGFPTRRLERIAPEAESKGGRDEGGLRVAFNADEATFIEGYYSGAEMLLAELKRRWSSGPRERVWRIGRQVIREPLPGPRELVNPVLFLIRHYFELQLKRLMKLLAPDPDLARQHRLIPLWQKVRGGLANVPWSTLTDEELDQAGRLFEYLEALDEKSEAFRYADAPARKVVPTPLDLETFFGDLCFPVARTLTGLEEDIFNDSDQP